MGSSQGSVALRFARPTATWAKHGCLPPRESRLEAGAAGLAKGRTSSDRMVRHIRRGSLSQACTTVPHCQRGVHNVVGCLLRSEGLQVSQAVGCLQTALGVEGLPLSDCQEHRVAARRSSLRHLERRCEVPEAGLRQVGPWPAPAQRLL